MAQFEYSNKFLKKFGKASKKIQAQVEERLRIFSSDQFNPILNNHSLHGEYTGCRSINITGNWRLVYENKGDNHYLLIDIGTHPQLFG